MPTQKDGSQNISMLQAIGVVCAVAAFTAIITIAHYQTKKNTTTTHTSPTPHNMHTEHAPATTTTKTLTPPKDKDIEQSHTTNSTKTTVGHITWLTQPQKSTLNIIPQKYLLSGTEEYCTVHATYHLTGEITTEPYNSYKIYTIDTSDNCEYMRHFSFRMLYDGTHAIFTNGSRPLEAWEIDMLTQYTQDLSTPHTINPHIIIPDLQYPKDLLCAGHVLHEKEACSAQQFYPQSYHILTKVCDSAYGPIWTTNRTTANRLYDAKENKSTQDHMHYEKFNTNAFYLKASDGSLIQYTHALDFLPTNHTNAHMAVLPITWHDGTHNDKEYELYPLGCGTQSFAYDMTDVLNPHTELTPIGTLRNGDTVYGYKDITHPQFQKTYTDIYWEKDGEKKSREAYLARHPQIFWIDPYNRLRAFYLAETISPAECGKPVIYLYPERTQDVTVTVAPKNGFTVTDPEHGDHGWTVEAHPDGTLINRADNKIYPYLFWEGQSSQLLPQVDKGFVVAHDALETFFTQKLPKLGLNATEIQDFIDFWVPQMRKDERNFYFITFLPQNFIHASAPLTITPQPDTVIRVLMHYTGLDTYKNVPAQKLIAPERTGFTVVEWGGILHK